MSRKKVGRVVGSRYLQKTENAPKTISSQVQTSQAPTDTAPKRRLSKPLSEIAAPRSNSSNIIKTPTTKAKLRSSNEQRTIPKNNMVESQGKSFLKNHTSDDFEHEQLSWAYLYQQSRLSLDDYQREQDNILINLAGQVVQLNEELYEKQSIIENDRHLEADVSNLKRALSSITRINGLLDASFLGHYDEITRELGARINQIELENAIVNNQGALENTLNEINALLSSIPSNLGHDLKTCRLTLDNVLKECEHVNVEASKNATLLDQVNQAKIKNMGLFTSTEFQSEDSNK